MLNIQDAAAYLKVNDQTLRRFAREGKVPAFRLGRTWRFRKSALDAWADSQQKVDGQPSPSAHATVLVVDDEMAIREVVSRLLEARGFDVSTAPSGVEALELMGKALPDLVLLDLKMPGMDGPATLAAIRARWGRLPVIVLTGYPDSELMSKALKHSPVTLLAKPMDSGQMLQAINDALRASKRGLQ